MNAAHRELLDVIAEVDRRQSYREDGRGNLSSWVEAVCQVAHRTASAWVVAARQLVSRPDVADAFSEGVLSFDKVTPAAELEMPVEVAAATPVKELKQQAVAARPAPDPAEAHQRRYFHLEDDGALYGRLTPEAATRLRRELTVRAENMAPNRATGVRDPFHARMADALMSLLDGSPAGRPTTKPVVIATVDMDRHTATTTDGTPVAFATAERLMCSSDVLLAVMKDGEPMQMGGDIRCFSERQRLWILARDNYTCVIEGCGSRHALQCHHFEPASAGGPTNTDNGGAVCYGDHHRLHEGGFTATRAGPRQWRLMRPDGTPTAAGTIDLIATLRAHVDAIRRG